MFNAFLKYLTICMMSVSLGMAVADEAEKPDPEVEKNEEESDELPEPQPIADLIQSVTSHFPTDEAPEIDAENVRELLSSMHTGKVYSGLVSVGISRDGGTIYFRDLRISQYKSLAVWTPVSAKNIRDGEPLADLSGYDSSADTVIDILI